MPPNVLIPYTIGALGGNLPHGDTAGFLGKAYDPFVLNADPSDPNFKVPDMLPPDYISAVRVDRRRDWRQVIDQSVKYFEKTNQDAKLMDATFNQAYTLMTSAKAREAFELTQEPEDMRKRYGMTRIGQGCLLARRLVERGVRFVTVNMFETVFNDITWDIHGSAPFSPIQCYSDLVGPMFDNAYSSLLEDLSERGCWKATLVLATGEFGRTPANQSRGGPRPLAAMLDRRLGRRRHQGRPDCGLVGHHRRRAQGSPRHAGPRGGYGVQVPWGSPSTSA